MEFLNAVRGWLPKKRRPTAAEVAELHNVNIEPARQGKAEAVVLERQLSELVNIAYASRRKTASFSGRRLLRGCHSPRDAIRLS